MSQRCNRPTSNKLCERGSSVTLECAEIFLIGKWFLPPLSSKIIEIPDESEKSPVLEKKEEVDSAAAKEDKEKEAENGDGSKEKETEDASKEKEEKDKTSEMEKDTTAEGEGSDGKNNEGEASAKTFISVSFSFIFCYTNSTSLVSVEGGKDEKMDVSLLTEDKKGAHMSELTHTLKLKYGDKLKI